MTTTYKRSLYLWDVYQLNSAGKWILLGSFKKRNDADQYAKIIKANSLNPVRVVFAND
ncbi:hypothetical protein WJM97_22275 [Okeanomitos corallinicola TIOX110]|uniref:SPOR domain-containing protein n=1 Tax=Okeanomitos corallinicola TIOX110 TaxID=3133117 RepID=A0ABZ2USV3_9CYAN